jgi:hypothetical protein
MPLVARSSLGCSESRLRSTSSLARESGSGSLDTAGDTVLVAHVGTNSLGGGASRGHVRIDVGEDVGATVLVDQVDVVGSGLALDGHELELVDDILESTTGSESGVSSLDVGLGAVGSIDDSLVVELINLSVESNKSGLLESSVVLNAGAGVEEVGDHGGIGHPVGDSCGEVTSCGGLTVGSDSASAKASVHILGSLLLSSASGGAGLLLSSTALLLSSTTRLLVGGSIASSLAVACLGKGSSEDCGGEERGDENVLHGECKCNRSDQPNWILSA